MTRGAGVVVAVVDTGVAPAPDLAGRLLPGWNVIARSDDATDDNGHGTHVAGTVAEVEGNGLAESGVAPEASILPVKVLDSTGVGSDADVAAGIVWAADHGARIVNLSLGGSEASTVLADGVAYAREQGRADRRRRGQRRRRRSPCPPAWRGVHRGRSRRREIACARPSAPEAGRSIWSLPASASCSRRSTASAATPTARWSGTSMASPQVAGVAALALAAGRARTATGVARLLTRTALDLGVPGRDAAYGAGLVRADAALGVCAVP